MHLFTQASRLAFADRAMYLGDPDVINVPVAGLLDPAYLAQRSALIDPAKDMGTAVSRHAAAETRRLRAADARRSCPAPAICPSSTIAAKSCR